MLVYLCQSWLIVYMWIAGLFYFGDFSCGAISWQNPHTSWRIQSSGNRHWERKVSECELFWVFPCSLCLLLYQLIHHILLYIIHQVLKIVYRLERYCGLFFLVMFVKWFGCFLCYAVNFLKSAFSGGQQAALKTVAVPTDMYQNTRALIDQKVNTTPRCFQRDGC